MERGALHTCTCSNSTLPSPSWPDESGPALYIINVKISLGHVGHTAGNYDDPILLDSASLMVLSQLKLNLFGCTMKPISHTSAQRSTCLHSFTLVTLSRELGGRQHGDKGLNNGPHVVGKAGSNLN